MLNQILNIIILAFVSMSFIYIGIIRHKNTKYFYLSPDRNALLDIFKAFAIFNIIFIHTVWWSGQKYIPYEEIGQISLFVDVPLFFFLSGWATIYQENNLFTFLKRIIQIYIPYVLYGFILITIYILYHKKVFTYRDIIDYLFFDFGPIFNWSTLVGALWFIRLYFLILIITPFLKVIAKHNILSLILIAITVSVNIFYTIKNEPPLQFQIPGIWDPQQLSFYIFFYFLGIYTQNIYLTKKELFIIIIINTLIILFCSSINADVFNLQKNKFPPNIFYLLSSLYSVVLVLFVKKYEIFIKNKIRENRLFKFISLCGEKVYSIFFCQHIGGALIYHIVYKFNYLNWFSLIIISYILNLIISITTGFLFDSVNKFYIRNIKRALIGIK